MTWQEATNLRHTLNHIDSRSYKVYRDIRGVYNFDDYALYIDYVQADPFAAPSRVRVRVAKDRAGFPEDTFSTKSREIALRDYLARTFSAAIRGHSKGDRGSGKSGRISIDTPRQEILDRTAIIITPAYIEARFTMGLPAFGRQVAGRQAENMFFDELPAIVNDSLVFSALDRDALYQHIECAEDADALRLQLADLGLVAFVADGAILPRVSGIDARPMEGNEVIPFASPESLRVTVELPNCGSLTGLGIPRGITLIVGGGYHGKSTLLNALEQGIYNHIPGDGRERVVADPAAVKIRAEDGRRIEKVGITPFIANLPLGRQTDAFSTDDASGSTSQAANIIEALEIGCSALLIDEDTSATNFMIRDHRMQELVAKDLEPITPFIDKVRQLYDELQVSTVLVIGGSGDYFDVADTVLCMVDYKPKDVTAEARRIAERYRAERAPEGGASFGKIIQRMPISESFSARLGKKEEKIKQRGLNIISFGKYDIDLSALEQLTDVSQTRALGDALQYAKKHMSKETSLRQVVEAVRDDVEKMGLDVLSKEAGGDYAQFRVFELAAALNRCRGLEVRQADL